MSQSSGCVIVGASHAGVQAAISLRQQGWTDSISLVGDDDRLPYHRPPLSKAFLSGEKKLEDILLRPQAVYEKADVQLLLGKRVSSITPSQRTLAFDDGELLGYEKLILATGCRVRRLPLPGADLKGVFYLRTVSHVEQMRDYVAPGKCAVVIGGGYIGLETAAQLRKLGMKVTVLEAMDRALQRVTSEEVSDFYTRIHREEGVEIIANTVASALLGSEGVERVDCQDGTSLQADLVVIGVGVIPETELAENAGIDVDNGILVNEFGQTSDQHIYAAGDCTSHFSPVYQRQLRLESVQNAVEQATCVAKAICGKPEPYNAVPWFWSDQFDVQLKIAGLSQGYDQLVIRGNAHGGRAFTVFYLREGALLAADAINQPKEFMAAKKLIASGKSLDALALADINTPITELI